MELLALWAALLLYTVAATISIFSVVFRKRPERTILTLCAVGVGMHSLALILRWVRLGHAPFNNMFEMLSWNVWGMMLALTIVYWRIASIRPIAAVIMPIVILVMGWMLLIPKDDSLPPVTYDTVWLYIHIAFIKVFLGGVLIAVGLAGVILLRRSRAGMRWFERLPNDASLDELAYRCMLFGLIFDTLGILAGAIWAQDAWGRYWSWDPLEVWSFMTWLTLGLAIHARINLKLRPTTGAILVMGVFVVAFLTFFGVPFVSTALHKGAV